MSNLKMSEQGLQELHKKYLADEVIKAFLIKIANYYACSVPFFVQTEDGSINDLEYPLETRNLVRQAQSQMESYIEMNYPELIVPF